VPLGCSEQAKAVCFYLLKYITKDSTALENTRVVVREAVRHIHEHASTADDTGTASRTRKHLLERVVNSIAGAQEISAQMAATALLGKPSCFTSDGFWVAYIWPAVQHVKRMSTTPTWAENDTRENPTDGLAGENSDDAEELVQTTEDVELLPDGTCETLHDDDEGNAGVFPTVNEHGAKKRVVIAQHTHYKHRGVELEIFSFYEFVSLVTIHSMSEHDREELKHQHPQPPTDDEIDTWSQAETRTRREGAGRTPNSKFQFEDVAGEPHPLKYTHMMQLRSKRMVPILAGAAPPPLPAAPFRHKDSSDRFAAYMMTLLCPWELQSGLPNNGDVTYPAFCRMMHTWSSNHGPGLEARLGRLRAFWAENIARGLRVNTKKKQIQTLYRYSAATRWTDDEQAKAKRHGWNGAGDTADDKDIETEGAMGDLLLLAARKITKGRVSDDDKARTYLNECEKMLNQLCGRENTNSETTPGDGRQPLPRPQCLTPKWSAVERRTDHSIPTGDVIENLCRPDDDVDESDSSASLDGHDNDDPEVSTDAVTCESAPPEAAAGRLNQKQQAIFDHVVSWHCELKAHRLDPTRSPPKRLLALVHGPPGTGKTRVADEIANRIPCLALAPTGISASMFLNASTFHSGLGIPVDTSTRMRALSENQLSELRTYLDGKDLVLLDEVSFVDGQANYRISQRLCEIKGIDEPYGGMGVVVSSHPSLSMYSNLSPPASTNKCVWVVVFRRLLPTDPGVWDPSVRVRAQLDRGRHPHQLHARPGGRGRNAPLPNGSQIRTHRAAPVLGSDSHGMVGAPARHHAHQPDHGRDAQRLLRARQVRHHNGPAGARAAA
jgi:hypothetical protein